MKRWRDAASWVAVLAVMLPFLGTPAVQRTQEARVMETAREMLGQPARNWMVPHLNGELRLEKPPLAYWLSAAAMRVGGVNAFAGRLPTLIAGWLTLMVVFCFATHLFDRATGWYSAVILLGLLMFARHARLAETDIYATLFVTLAIYAFARERLALSGTAIGLAVLAKGLPSLFAVVFFMAYSIDRRDRRVMWRWMATGLPLAALIALPWYGFIGAELGWSTFWTELRVGVQGEEHTASFVKYFPELLRATAPWTGLSVLSVVAAGMRWRTCWQARLLLIWALSIFLPLCVAGQKQFHYLLPMMPPLAILTAWSIRDVNANAVLKLTAAALALAPPLIVLGGHRLRGGVLPIDLVLAATFAGGGALTWWRGAAGLGAGAVVLVMLLQQAWVPSHEPVGPREVAAALRGIDDGPYFFYGPNISYPLVFEMREVMPRLLTVEQLIAAAQVNPGMIAVAQTKSGVSPPPLPQGFERVGNIDTRGQRFEFYRVERPTR